MWRCDGGHMLNVAPISPANQEDSETYDWKETKRYLADLCVSHGATPSYLQ